MIKCGYHGRAGPVFTLSLQGSHLQLILCGGGKVGKQKYSGFGNLNCICWVLPSPGFSGMASSLLC